MEEVDALLEVDEEEVEDREGEEEPEGEEEDELLLPSLSLLSSVLERITSWTPSTLELLGTLAACFLAKKSANPPFLGAGLDSTS